MAAIEYRKLVDYGLNPKVARELCGLFESGKVSPQELDNRALDALKECNVNEAIGVIKTFAGSERTNVKNKSGYLCGMIKKQRQKQASPGPAMPRNQGEKSDFQLSKALSYILRHGAEKLGYKMMPGGFLYVEDILKKQKNLCDYDLEDVKRVVETNDKQRFHMEWDRETGKLKIRANQGHTIETGSSSGFPPNMHPGWQPNTMNTNQYQGGPQGMYTNQGYNQPNQYQGRPQGMYANQGYNQPPNQYYQGYNQPPHPQNYGPGLAGMMPPPLSPVQNMNQPQQNVQYVMMPVPVSSVGAPPGQGPAPYAPPLMGQYNPNLPQGNLNIIDHQGSPQRDGQTPDREKQPKKKRSKKDKQKMEENEIQDHTRSGQTNQFEEDGFIKLKSLLSEEPEEHYRVETGVIGEDMDDDSKRGGGRGRKRRGGRGRKGRGGQNKQQDEKQDSESSENEEDKDEMDKYMGSRDDLRNQRSSRGSRGNLNKNFGSVDSIASQGSRQNRRGRGGYNRGRGGQTSHMDEEKSPQNEEIGQSNRGHQGVRGRGRGQQRGRGGHGHNENRNEIRENEGEDTHGNQRGRGKGRDRGRGIGGRQQNERTNELEDEDIPDVDDNDVFKFLVKTFGGGCTFEDFLRRCDLFPMDSNICLWFRKHSRRFHVFWEGKDIIYVQPFFQDAKICVRWNNKKNPGECKNAQCDFFHICRRFIRGNCKDKDCPLSHSFRNLHNRHLKDKLGISDFSDVDIKIVLNCNSPSVCADYIYNNGCKVENAEKRCPHLHLCRIKIFGKCDDPCKFKKTHSITQFHNKWVLTSCHMKGWPAARVFKAIYVPPRQREVSEDYSDDSDLSQDDDDADDASVRYDSDVNISSESLSSTASGPARKFNKLITSVENLSIEDVRERGKMKLGRRERFKSSEDIICGIVGKDDHGLPKLSAPQQKYVDDDDIKERERILMEKYKQEKQGTSSGKVVKPKPPPRPSKVSPSDPDYQERNPSVLKDDIDISKICIFVSKDKCPSASCKNLHLPSGIPYLWQIKMFGKWFSLTLAENEKMEKGYCDLLDVESTEVKYMGIKYRYRIRFSNMQAIIYDVDGQPAVADNTSCDVRRLSTPSFAEKKMMVDSYLTQWRWYWKDDSRNWNMYTKDVFLFTLERKYQTKQKTYLYTRENYYFMYRIDFQKMTQINLDTDKERKIIRRPLFVSKDDVQQKKYPDSIPFPAAMSTAKPMHFYHWDCAHDFELVELDITGKEFIDVIKSLQDSMSPTRFGIKFIYRIQNRKLWSEYDIKKKLMLADAEQDGRGQNIDERDLFHGTDSLDTCRGICTNNFDFRTSGRNATLYGEGSYFAVRAKMSHSYTKADLPTDIRFMFRAKVLVGQFTTGNPSLRRPPEIFGQVHKLYDSCVDKDHDPHIFVVFDRNQCYPEYLIMYTDRETLPPVDQTIAASSISSISSYGGDPLVYSHQLGSPTSPTMQSFPQAFAGSAEESPAAFRARLNEHSKRKEEKCVLQ
ncbi:PARP7S [Mytilus coruscus]|uniref:2'-phosphotransferase n=1 Tax=Mytilus coruscus TaxID=42192 RepID=A0A6J8CXL2_MYTCO|nr:PARP7S [Mytilus coruscus]